MSDLMWHCFRDFLLVGAAFFGLVELLKRTYRHYARRRGRDAGAFDPLWWWLPLIGCTVVWVLSHHDDLGWEVAGPLGVLDGLFGKLLFWGFNSFVKREIDKRLRLGSPEAAVEEK